MSTGQLGSGDILVMAEAYRNMGPGDLSRSPSPAMPYRTPSPAQVANDWSNCDSYECPRSPIDGDEEPDADYIGCIRYMSTWEMARSLVRFTFTSREEIRRMEIASMDEVDQFESDVTRRTPSMQDPERVRQRASDLGYTARDIGGLAWIRFKECIAELRIQGHRI